MKFTTPQIFHGLALASYFTGSVLNVNATIRTFIPLCLPYYDDLTATPVLETAIGTYKDLIYNAWVLGGSATGSVAIGGVAPESPPNTALTSITEQSTNGTPSFVIAPPYKSFSLLDFWFGCVVRTGESTANVALQCTITVAGFKANNDQEIALASFTFTPPVSPIAPVPMIHAVLPSSFQQALYIVTLTQSNTLAAVRLDNMHYDVST